MLKEVSHEVFGEFVGKNRISVVFQVQVLSYVLLCLLAVFIITVCRNMTVNWMPIGRSVAPGLSHLSHFD